MVSCSTRSQCSLAALPRAPPASASSSGTATLIGMSAKADNDFRRSSDVNPKRLFGGEERREVTAEAQQESMRAQRVHACLAVPTQ